MVLNTVLKFSNSHKLDTSIEFASKKYGCIQRICVNLDHFYFWKTGHYVSNQPLVVRVTSQIWLKLLSKVHQYMYNEHMQNEKFQLKSRFEISAHQS